MTRTIQFTVTSEETKLELIGKLALALIHIEITELLADSNRIKIVNHLETVSDSSLMSLLQRYDAADIRISRG